jgi:1-acyl-sn-glycerol-3-phosphate acyltransferase
MPRRADPFGFDPPTAERWLGWVRAAMWSYFRPQVIGAEHLPKKGRGLIIGCHSGTIPYDAACTLVAIHAANGRYARSIGDNLFGRVPGVEDFLRQQGALVGRPEVVEAVLHAGHLLLLFPGGSRDMERPYLTQRYQVLPHRGFAPGHGGYIKIALRTRAPIIPLAVVGAEEAHVMLGTAPLLAQVFGVPFFPLLLFPWPLPVKLYIRFGEPIVLPGTPADADDQRRVDQLNIMVRQRVQLLIDDTVRRRHGVILSAYDSNGTPVPAPRRRSPRSHARRQR